MNRKYYKWFVAFEGDQDSSVHVSVVADYHDAAVEKAWYVLDKLPTKVDEIFEVVHVARDHVIEGSDTNPFKPFRYSLEIQGSVEYESECPYAE